MKGVRIPLATSEMYVMPPRVLGCRRFVLVGLQVKLCGLRAWRPRGCMAGHGLDLGCIRIVLGGKGVVSSVLGGVSVSRGVVLMGFGVVIGWYRGGIEWSNGGISEILFRARYPMNRSEHEGVRNPSHGHIVPPARARQCIQAWKQVLGLTYWSPWSGAQLRISDRRPITQNL